MPLAESVKLILCLIGINVSLEPSAVFSVNDISFHIGQYLTFNDFLTRHVLAESLLWITAEETSCRNSVMPLR